jgi:tetratricopeptide (TPR) repeat protein
MAKATQAAEQAMALAPEMPGVHLALGYYHLYTHRDSKKALDQFAIAEKGFPHNVDILEAKMSVYLIEGRLEESLMSAREAVELSPRDASMAVELAERYWILRRYEGGPDLHQAIELAPDDARLIDEDLLSGAGRFFSETGTILRPSPLLTTGQHGRGTEK